MSRKLLGLIAVMICLLFVLSACTTGTTGSTTATKATTAATTTEAKSMFPLEEPIELTYLMAENVPFNEEWLTYSTLKEKTNINFVYQSVSWAEIGEKCELMAASKELPDLAYSAYINDKKWGKDGLLLDLTPYFNDGSMPNYKKLADKYPEWYEMIPDKSNEGKFYIASTFFAGDYCIPQALVIRQDIFDQNDIDVPTTWEGFYEAGKTLKEKYPNSYLISTQYGTDSLLSYMAPAWETSLGIYYNEKEKQWKYGPTEANFKEFIQFVNKLYADEILDPEFSVMTSTLFFEKLYNGLAFSAHLWMPLNSTRSIEGQQTTAGLKLTTVIPPLKVDGKDSKVKGWNVALTGNGVVASAATENPDVVAALLDYLYSDEMVELFNWGIEGVTFTKDADGNRIFNSDIITGKNVGATKDKEVEYGIFNTSSGLPMVQLQFYDTPNFDEQTATEVAALKSMVSSIAVFPKATPLFTDEESETIATAGTDYNTYYNENILKFITGDLDFDQWDTFVQTLNEYGVEEVLEIYNSK